ALPYGHTFDTFVVGPGNALAREASLAVARGRQPGLSPLFLLGPAGTGKSHLARAVVTEARQTGAARPLYASAETFTSELLASIRRGHTGEFKRRYRQGCDLLVLEDVQFLQGKTATQLELFHTLEHLARGGRRIVLTGDRLPRDIPRLDARLISWMGSGLVAELEAPDRELRRAILREKAARGGVRIPDDCLYLLADAALASVRDLEGVLIQLVATASLLQRPVDRGLTEAALRKVVRPPSAEPGGALGVQTVIETVAGFFGTPVSALASRSRKRSVLVPRQLAMYLCRRFTDASLVEIGRALGRDHPAVRHAVASVERAILERAPLRYQVEALVERLEARRRG
ncbi:MAG: chromosomal replication initiator protein DnaA, partial [Myxococcota bacterium]|nr:chromosomal replication initiator protein DnaA [Myxococcota bacterium]